MNWPRNELLEYRAALYLELAATTRLLVQAVIQLLKKSGQWMPAYNELLDNLTRYVVLKKQDIWKFESVFEHCFDFDLTKVFDRGECGNLQRVVDTREKVILRFFHNDKQKSHIRNVARLNEHNAIGLGKLLQFNNLRVMFRTTERIAASL